MADDDKTIQGYKKQVEEDLSSAGGVDRVPTGKYKDPKTGKEKMGSMTLGYPGGTIRRDAPQPADEDLDASRTRIKRQSERAKAFYDNPRSPK